MGILDSLFGGNPAPRPGKPQAVGGAAASADEQAIARYRYMLQTAPPQTLEQAHAEAFARLTPEQRALLLQRLAAEMPEAERHASTGTLKDDPQSLARLATRAEVRQPGTLERSFAGMGGRGGIGGMMAGSLLAGVAGAVIGSAIAQSFFGDAGASEMGQGDQASADGVEDGGGDIADAGDFGGDDFGDV